MSKYNQVCHIPQPYLHLTLSTLSKLTCTMLVEMILTEQVSCSNIHVYRNRLKYMSHDRMAQDTTRQSQPKHWEGCTFSVLEGKSGYIPLLLTHT